jgi:hypothetical protein
VKDGRRLIREGEFMYVVPTWEHYRSVRNDEERKAYNRLAKRRSRERSSQMSMTVSTGQPRSAQAEAEAEAVPEEKRASRARTTCEKPEGVSEEVWNEWVAHRKRKRASVSTLVLGQVRDGAARVGWTVEQYLAAWVKSGTQGFEPEWVMGNKSGGKWQKPIEHIRNMPLGASGCGCEDCLKFRAKQAAVAT